MKHNNKIALLLYALGVGLILFIFIFLVSVSIIGFSVKENCLLAQQRYSGDCVAALIGYLNDEENDFESRNMAIWALGQLGDRRALGVLESYYTGYEGGRFDRSSGLSQLELKRAIGYMNGNLNITPFFWRFGQGISYE